MTINIDGSLGVTFPNGSNPQAAPSKVLQVVQSIVTTGASNNTNIYATTGLTVSITPQFTTSTILVMCNFGWSCNTADFGFYAFAINGTVDSTSQSTMFNQSATGATNSIYFASLSKKYSPASISTQTYALYFNCGNAPSQTMYFNQRGVGGANGMCTITAMEIAA